jgi:hypothetical protein
MFFDFATFTKYFFYLFVCYHYANHHYPEKTQNVIIFVGYNSLYIYSKLQILLNKIFNNLHNYLIKNDKYQQLISFLQKMKDEIDIVREHVFLHSSLSNSMTKSNDVILHFVIDNKIEFIFEKNEFLITYFDDFFSNDSTTNENETEEIETEKSEIIDYDFIILNGEDNLKKIIKDIHLIKNDLDSKTDSPSIFKIEPFLYKPLLCEFINGDDDKVIKIDFSDNNKFYDFLVVDNYFDKTFLTFFMKNYYDVDVSDNYSLKILDNNVNTLLFESSDIVKIEDNCISKVSK